MHSCLIKAEDLFSEPKGASIKGVIFSGGPFSVYEDGAPHVDESKTVQDASLKLERTSTSSELSGDAIVPIPPQTF